MKKIFDVKYKKIILIILILLGIIFLFEIYHFLNIKYNFEIPCIFHKITGLYCPGCGLTRMLFSIINLDFYQAFRYNPLLFICLPFLIIYFVYGLLMYLNNKKNNLISKIPKSITISLLIITILYGILRNIEMFSFLKPTIIK